MTIFNKKILLITLALMSMAVSNPFQDPDFIPKSLESLKWMTVSMMFVGATALIMFVILIIQLLKMRNARIMAMISKGIYQPKPKDWKRILMLVGLLLLCTTPGVMLMVILQEGLLTGIGVGSTMLLGGIGVLVFRHLAREYLPSPSENENQ